MSEGWDTGPDGEPVRRKRRSFRKKVSEIFHRVAGDSSSSRLSVGAEEGASGRESVNAVSDTRTTVQARQSNKRPSRRVKYRYRRNYQLMSEEGHAWWLYSDLEGDYFR